MIALAAKLGATLLAVLAMGWFARWLGVGGDVRIRDANHAKQIADLGLYGFAASDAVVDRAGYSALLRDAAGHHALVTVLGNRFVTRRVVPPIEGRLDQKLLTIDLNEPAFGPVTLNLGEAAQYWASGLRHMPHA